MNLHEAGKFTILAASLGYPVAKIKEAASALGIAEEYALLDSCAREIVMWIRKQEYGSLQER